MNFREYTNLIASIAVDASRMDGDLRCDFNNGFYEKLARNLPSERIQEFADIYGKKVGVNYSDFRTVCHTIWVNRKREHHEFPELCDVIESLMEMCEHHFF